MSSNLPPGCSSPDGGIDHDYEQAIEAFCEIALDASEVRAMNAIAPAIVEAVRDAYKAGFQEGIESEKQRRDMEGF